jgi:hypothetical protein
MIEVKADHFNVVAKKASRHVAAHFAQTDHC